MALLEKPAATIVMMTSSVLVSPLARRNRLRDAVGVGAVWGAIRGGIRRGGPRKDGGRETTRIRIGRLIGREGRHKKSGKRWRERVEIPAHHGA